MCDAPTRREPDDTAHAIEPGKLAIYTRTEKRGGPGSRHSRTEREYDARIDAVANGYATVTYRDDGGYLVTRKGVPLRKLRAVGDTV